MKDHFISSMTRLHYRRFQLVNCEFGDLYSVYSCRVYSVLNEKTFTVTYRLVCTGYSGSFVYWPCALYTIYTKRRNVFTYRSEEHTSELQSRFDLVCRLLLEKKQQIT